MVGPDAFLRLAAGESNALTQHIEQNRRRLNDLGIVVSSMTDIIVAEELQRLTTNPELRREHGIMLDKVAAKMQVFTNQKCVMPIGREAAAAYNRYLRIPLFKGEGHSIRHVGVAERLLIASCISGFADKPITLLEHYHRWIDDLKNELLRSSVILDVKFID